MKRLILITASMSILFALVSGGLYPLDPKDGYKILLSYERIIDSQMNSPYVHRILTFLHGSVRLFNRLGILYTCNFVLGETFCPKQITSDVTQCPVQYNVTRTYTCRTHISHYISFNKYSMDLICRPNN